MTNKPDKQTKKEEKKVTREAELEHENELLRLEIAYLKKCKQNWHSNLKKKESDLKDIFLVVSIPETTFHYHVKSSRK